MSKKKEFERYIRKLQSLSPERTLLCGEKIAIFLSGSSDWQTACLREPQKNLMQILARKGYFVADSNFPYHLDFESQRVTHPPIWKAGIRNMIYAWHTLFHSDFRQEICRHLKPLTEAKEVVIITGSSGLNMLNEVLPHLDFAQTRLTVFALGPMSVRKWNTDKEKLYVIKGRKDWYSRILDSHPENYLVNCNHYDYGFCSEVKEILKNTVK